MLNKHSLIDGWWMPLTIPNGLALLDLRAIWNFHPRWQLDLMQPRNDPKSRLFFFVLINHGLPTSSMLQPWPPGLHISHFIEHEGTLNLMRILPFFMLPQTSKDPSLFYPHSASSFPTLLASSPFIVKNRSGGRRAVKPAGNYSPRWGSRERTP